MLARHWIALSTVVSAFCDALRVSVSQRSRKTFLHATSVSVPGGGRIDRRKCKNSNSRN
jgi:hypothetical protein